MPLVTGNSQKGFLAGEEYEEGTPACRVIGLLRFLFNKLVYSWGPSNCEIVLGLSAPAWIWVT